MPPILWGAARSDRGRTTLVGMTGHDLAHEFPIVGIGASAGGLAAFEAFLSGMPSDRTPGMALVLVQHLAPDHESHLVDLVRRQTDLEVLEVTDGVKVEQNCVYVIPPAKAMVLRHGRMQLLEPTEPRGHRLPVDFFFRSLAEEEGEKAICVVLSGTGSDGTLGVRAVKGPGRAGPGAGPGLDRVRRHAPQRHRHRHGGPRPAGERDACPLDR